MISVLLAIAIGIIAIYSISINTTKNLAFYQIVFSVIGIILIYIFIRLDYRALSGASWVIYLVSILLLIFVVIFGERISGASRWINVGFFQIQPSEIAKISLILTLSNFLANRKDDFKIKDFILAWLIILIPAILVVLEPDFGTAITYIIIGLAILVASNIKKIYLLATTSLFIVMAPLVWLFALKEYQKQRLISFLNPQADPFGTGYNVLQSTIAIGSGQLFGKGLGHGSQSQLNFLPIQHSDFIFAVIAEELGFLGAGILLLILLFIIFRIINVARLARDDFGLMVAVGIVAMFIFQIFVNIGMNLGLMPITGIPLPFVSYGGSSLLIGLVAIGIIESIYQHHKKIKF